MNWSFNWHDRQKKILENIAKNPVNSYLFSWEKWIWKLQMAKDFAKIILRVSEEDSEKIDKNILPDCIIMDKLWIEWCDETEVFSSSNFPQNQRKTKPKAKTDIIWIDDIHEIIKISNKTPQILTKKVIILRDIERMNAKSANAFLKTLEEPADDTFFICTSSNKNLLLDTIISRLQIINFEVLNNNNIKDFLVTNNFEWDSEKAVNYSFWKLSRAKLFLSEDEYLEKIEAYLKIIEQLYVSTSHLEKVKRATYQTWKDGDLSKEIEYWAFFLQEKIKSWDKKASSVFENYLILIQDLKSNVNKKLALENFYFSF